MKPHVLVVDDERKIRLILKRLLEGLSLIHISEPTRPY